MSTHLSYIIILCIYDWNSLPRFLGKIVAKTLNTSLTIKKLGNEIMNKIIQEIKKFFNSEFNTQVEIHQEETEDNNVKVEIKFEPYVELTEEEYEEKLDDFLKKLGFYPSNTWENKTNDFWKYATWIGVEEYINDTDDELDIYYDKVWSNGETTYFIKKIEIKIELEENLQENGTA